MLCFEHSFIHLFDQEIYLLFPMLNQMLKVANKKQVHI